MLFINTGSCSGKHHHDAGKDLKNQLKRKKKKVMLKIKLVWETDS